MAQDILDTARIWDVAVVGAGVVGCAVARAFALEGAAVLLLEKGGDILSGASKANSAILHTGFDAPPDTLEHACVQAGHAEYLELHERFNLPLWKSGAMVAAWTEEQLGKLPAIVAKAHKNGVTDVRQIDAAEAKAMEPALADHIKGAVLVPREYLIDPWSAPLAYVHQAIGMGASVVRSCPVEGGDFDGSIWKLKTPKGLAQARVVINCAGLYGDQVENIARPSPFVIKPRKGQFLVFDKNAAALIHSILLPVPTERTKGIVLTRTIFGNLLLGPTAEEQEDREHAFVDEGILRQLREQGEQMLPGLKGESVTAIYAGLRTATEKPEYRVEALSGKNWITVGGIRSTGLTSALSLARHIVSLYRENFGISHTAPGQDAIPWPQMPRLDQDGPRDFTRPGNEGIVCHCEMVSRREIVAALNSPLPPGDLGGLKRRTRAMMGRCQGFHCGATLAEMTREHFGLTVEEKPHE